METMNLDPREELRTMKLDINASDDHDADISRQERDESLLKDLTDLIWETPSGLEDDGWVFYRLPVRAVIGLLAYVQGKNLSPKADFHLVWNLLRDVVERVGEKKIYRSDKDVLTDAVVCFTWLEGENQRLNRKADYLEGQVDKFKHTLALLYRRDADNGKLIARMQKRITDLEQELHPDAEAGTFSADAEKLVDVRYMRRNSGGYTDKAWGLVREAYMAGMPVVEISRQTGILENTIERRMRKDGVMRDRTEQEAET